MVLPRRTEMLLLLLIALFPRIARAQPPVIKLALMLPFALWNDSGSSMLERAWRGAQMAAEEINADDAGWFGGVDLNVDMIDDALPTRQDKGTLIATTQRVIANGYNGVLGDRYSDATKMIAYTLATTGIFQCSVWATSPGLSDKQEFPTFYRLVADDNFQALVILELVITQNWNKIGVLAGTESYGQGLLDKILSSAPSYGISVLASYTFDLNDQEGLNYRLTQLKDLGARVILFFPNGEHDAVQVFRELKANGMVGPDYAYIGGDNLLEVYKAAETDEDRQNLQGLMVTEPLEYSDSTNEFEDKFKARWGVAPPSGAVAWYDATYSFAWAFKKIMADHNYTPADIASNRWLEQKLNVTQFTDFSFTGAMGETSWQKNGDSASAMFHVLNIVNDQYVEVARGQTGELKITKPPTFFSGSTVPPLDTPQLQDELIGYSKAGPAVIIAITSILAIVITISMPLLGLFRNHAILKPVSPMFMAFSALGMLVCLLTIYVDAIRIPNKVSCNAYMALMALGFGTVVGGIFVKLRRLYKIFDNKIAQRRALRTSTLFLNSGVIVLVELILVLIWSGAFPLLAVEHADIASGKHYYECVSSNQTAGNGIMIALFVYNGILTLACCYLAYATRNIYSAFNEAKAIGIAIYNIFFCAIIIILVTYLASTSPITSFIIRSVCVIVAASVTYAALVARFLYGVLRKVDVEAFGAGGGSSDKPSSGTTTGSPIPRARQASKIPTGPFRSGTFSVRGSSRITTNQWKNHIVHIIAKPVAIFVVMNEKEPENGLALPLGLLNVAVKEDRILVRWAKGSLTIQTASPEEAEDWVVAIEGIQGGEGGNQSGKGSAGKTPIKNTKEDAGV